MKDTDPVVKHGRLTALYQRLTSSIECTLKHLAETAPDCPPPSEAAFSWRPLRGKDYFYMRIISDLNQKIGSGEYPRRTYLPHEKALAGQYGVSVSTVRKALAELEQRGFVKRLNGKGTVSNRAGFFPGKPGDLQLTAHRRSHAVSSGTAITGADHPPRGAFCSAAVLPQKNSMSWMENLRCPIPFVSLRSLRRF